MAKTGSKATTMADLLANDKELTIKQLRRGQVVEGEVLQVNETEVLVNVGAKSEGVIPQAEAKGYNLKPGDKVHVYVLTPEDRRGQLLLSLSRAQAAKGWIDLEDAFKNSKTIEVKVTGFNKGGLMVDDANSLGGFIPFSHTDSLNNINFDDPSFQSYLDKVKDKTLKVRIIELDREKNRIIFSEREAMLGETLKEKQDKISELKVGSIVNGKVTAVMPYGLMIDIGGIEGLVPIEEIVWDSETADEALMNYEVGSEVEAKIIETDESLGKVKLSLKRISVDPWSELGQNHKVGDTVKVTMTKITSYGVFANLDGVEGMIGLSSLPSDQQIKVGQEVNAKIDGINKDERRLNLSYSE